MSKKITIDNDVREKLSQFLPDALMKALTSYRMFMQQDIEVKENSEKEEGELDHKSFSTHHTACKAAISHVEHLLKLAEWLGETGVPPPDQNLHMISQAMIEEAVKEVEGYNSSKKET